MAGKSDSRRGRAASGPEVATAAAGSRPGRKRTPNPAPEKSAPSTTAIGSKQTKKSTTKVTNKSTKDSAQAGRAKAAARRAEAERQALLARPAITYADVAGPAPTVPAARIVGAVAVLAALLLVLSDVVPYLVLDGETARAPFDVFGVLSRLLTTGLLAGAGVLLVLGRGGRVALAAIVPFGLAAVGTALLVVQETADLAAHPSREYYFGRSFSTASLEAAPGHWLALAGQVALVLALAATALAWRSSGVEDRVPLGRIRLPVAGFGVAAGVLGALGLCVGPAAGAVRTTTAADGITEVPVDILTPAGPLDSVRLALVGGLLLAVGVLVTGLMGVGNRSRGAIFGGLVGLAAYLGGAWLANLRDIVRADDLVPGVRSYALLGAALLAVAGAVYVARVRGDDAGDDHGDDVLGSAAEDRLGVPVDESI